MSGFVQLVIIGLLAGGIYVAVGVGFSLVWGVLNIVNLAHGALVIVGAYLTWLGLSDANQLPNRYAVIASAFLLLFPFAIMLVARRFEEGRTAGTGKQPARRPVRERTP